MPFDDWLRYSEERLAWLIRAKWARENGLEVPPAPEPPPKEEPPEPSLA